MIRATYTLPSQDGYEHRVIPLLPRRRWRFKWAIGLLIVRETDDV